MNRLMVLAVLLGGALVVEKAMSYEEPEYRVLEQREGYEIRQYEPYLVAQTTIQGGFRDSGNQAFRILAGYIFGDNSQSKKMAMTVPVTSSLTQGSEARDRYDWQFVMERAYDQDSLPRPVDQRVSILEMPARTMAVRRYSGRTTEKNFVKNLDTLNAALQRDQVRSVGEPQSAVYNGPFTLPFFRRNEVLVEITRW